MEFHWSGDGSLWCRNVPHMAHLYLACLPKICDFQDHEKVRKRIFPNLMDPTETIDDQAGAEKDWKELVHSEFEEANFNAVELVLRDISEAEITRRPLPTDSPVVFGLDEAVFVHDSDDEEEEEEDQDERYFHFEIPEEHFEMWYRALNLARLVAGEKYGIPILPLYLEHNSDELERRLTEDGNMEDRLLAAACCRCYEPFLGVLIELMSTRL